MNPRIQRLRAELASDVRAFEARVDELHHDYGAIEAGLGRVVRMVKGSLPDGPDWHCK